MELRKKYPNTLIPLLGLLNLNGRPYNLEGHFFMEPVFNVQLPPRLLLKCGRQVTKSTSLAANSVLRSAGTPYLNTLFVTPRFEQIRRFSNNYIRPFVKQSAISHLVDDPTVVNQTLQRSLSNHSSLYFSFAFLDCERVRGISADIVNFDEVQDLDYDFIPLITECMSHSSFRISMFSGTPKTLDNTIEQLWSESSGAEWVIPCESCGYWSMSSIHADLLKMIEPKGLSCSQCKNLLNADLGHWYHVQARDHSRFLGYHIPQIIVPLHYSNPERWIELIEKRDGKHGYTQAKFLNEVLGESADVGVKLITITDIRRASKLGPNDFSQSIDRFRTLPFRAMGVDWGGGGEEEISFTTAALVGFDPTTGIVEVPYMERLHSGYSHDEEARRMLWLFTEAGCQFFAHDFGGAGAVRETLMIQAGIPLERIVPIMYVRSVTRDILTYHPPPLGEIRGYYKLDKARSLVLQAICVKSGTILLPEYESAKNLTSDFLSLIEEKREMAAGSDIYLIRRIPKQPDDLAHSINFGCCALWHYCRQWPDISKVERFKLTEEQLNLAEPPQPWSGG